jgi:hypothetical protein
MNEGTARPGKAGREPKLIQVQGLEFNHSKLAKIHEGRG